MIINTVHQYARKEDYDGYNDYYVNPEFKQPFERYARAGIEIVEDEKSGKSTKKVEKNRKNEKKVHFFCKKFGHIKIK